MSPSELELSSAVRDIVATNGQVAGSRLATALKERGLDWVPSDLGVRNLREFVATHVPDVVIVGRSGMDVLYGFSSPEGPPAPSPPRTALASSVEPDFWRVWVSPNSPFALIVDRGDVSIAAVHRGESSASPGHVLLNPPGIDFHRGVARDFLGQVPNELKARLEASLQISSEDWWRAWWRQLRASAQFGPWNAFRRDAFERELREQLGAAGVPERDVGHVLATIRERHLTTATEQQRVSAGGDRGAPAVCTGADGDLRRIVLEAVQRMSASELRDLRLPVGVVLDVLTASKSGR